MKFYCQNDEGNYGDGTEDGDENQDWESGQ